MKKISFFLLSCSLVNIVYPNAVLIAKKKHLYPLLTRDYGILDENDIAAYTWGIPPRPFTPEGPSGQYTYWQCFPRESIRVTLVDTGSSSDNFGWKDNIADLQIRVFTKPDFIHQYNMRARWTIKDFENRFDKWKNLMWGETYVCLAGSFILRERTIEEGKEKEIYQWIFEKMKTNKGCDSYFDSCKPTYTAYLQEKDAATALGQWH